MIYFEGQQRDVSKVEKLIKFALRFSCDSLTEQYSVSEAAESTNSDLEPKSKRVRSSDGTCVLSYADKETIMNGHELNDLHIDMAQKLLSSQYPNVSGLQTTLYQYKQPLASSQNAFMFKVITGLQFQLSIAKKVKLECMILFIIPLTKIPVILSIILFLDCT